MKSFFYIIFSTFILGLSQFCSAAPKAMTWIGSYYESVPNRENISAKYCEEHTPGDFSVIIKTNADLFRPIVTNKNIRLFKPTINKHLIHGIYFIDGDFWASGKTKNIEWQDHIYYYLYKLTEHDTAKGVWSSRDCKGLYKGYIFSPDK